MNWPAQGPKTGRLKVLKQGPLGQEMKRIAVVP